MTPQGGVSASPKSRQKLGRTTIRFAGDSGDGIQIAGGQFTNTTAIAGNDLATFPDFPAEIRAPAGTLPGVSGFQIQFSSDDIQTPGDRPDALVAFNPAALKVNLCDMARGTLIIVNEDSFEERDLVKAGYESNPLTDDSLASYRVVRVPVTKLTLAALEDVEITHKEKERCKNFFALGVVYWLYSRPLEPTLKFIAQTFGKKGPALVEANARVLKAGYNFAETTDLFPHQYEVPPAKVSPGTYRNISGNEALALGLVAASRRCGLPIFYGSYPITPASDILHTLSKYKNFGVITFQAEDEIAAVTAAIGASFAGALGVTGSSGPGVALKGEAIGLAIMTELPLIVCNIQRGGPSTGLPTKTEQADLLQAVCGRNSESPAAVLAPATPGDCFWIAFEAVRIATKYMVPVFILSDGYLANGAEPWKIPDLEELPGIEIKFRTDPKNFLPYERDEVTLARPWAKPGTPGLEHRIGGLEKANVTGNVSYDPSNHDLMVRLRASKVARIANEIPEAKVEGPWDAPMLMVGWGGTYGSIRAACEEANRRGMKVAHLHLRHLSPMPRNVGEILKRAGKVLVPELNLGQLLMLLRSRYLVDAVGINKVAGQPFRVAELLEAMQKEYETCRK
jgi:2-oxoglutarate ferredoxin oxidoreductase subunit alpha